MQKVKDYNGSNMPEVEFEGPLDRFWSMDDVPIEALATGAAEIVAELQRRGYQEDIIIELIKKAGQKLRTSEKK